MKCLAATSPARCQGYALLLVMFFAGAALLALSGVLSWTSNRALLAERNNAYYRAVAMAEAATETALSRLTAGFQLRGSNYVDNNLPTYGDLTALMANAAWINYALDNTTGVANRVAIAKTSGWTSSELESAFSSLRPVAATYRLAARVKPLTATGPASVAVAQYVQLASIPLCQFAVLYNLDLELTPTNHQTLTGRVHSNGSIYCQPDGKTLNFQGAVTASQEIFHDKNPLDPVTNRIPGAINYLNDHSAGIKSFNLPLGTNYSPADLHAIIDIPPAGEPVDSPLGQQRYYNKADLIILVSDTTGIAKSGAYNNFATTIPWTFLADTPTSSGFINTSNTFFNKRENKTVQATRLDIDNFMADASLLAGFLGRPVKTIYIADQRSSPTTQPGILLVHGQDLQHQGLTIATPNPLYVHDAFNVSPVQAGTTLGTAPAALIADAITVLSPNWDNANSTGTLRQRLASNTTINAAIVTGIVPTGGGYYSGGMDNAIRLLENWTSRTLTFNGSLAVLFPSRTAVAPWGASADVYIPPTRYLNFDTNFLDHAKLPPNTPALRTLIRTKWTTFTPDAS